MAVWHWSRPTREDPWRYIKDAEMWPLETWFSGGHSYARLMVALELKAFSNLNYSIFIPLFVSEGRTFFNSAVSSCLNYNFHVVIITLILLHIYFNINKFCVTIKLWAYFLLLQTIFGCFE